MQNETKASICCANIFIPNIEIVLDWRIVKIGLTASVTEKPISPTTMVLNARAEVRSLSGTTMKRRLVELTALADPKNRLTKR